MHIALWLLLAFFRLQTDDGVGIDPHGGRVAIDSTTCTDPNGGCVSSLGGGGMDPNGGDQSVRIDPNG